MKTQGSIQLLRDEEIIPTETVLEEALGKDVFAVYTKLNEIIRTEFQIEPEWRYYKDGKSWLYKAVYKKKTIFWLSIWEKFIKISLLFTEKHVEEFMIWRSVTKLKKASKMHMLSAN